MPSRECACGNRTDVGRFCPVCGAEQPEAKAPPADPRIGRVVGGRYRIVELINEGGMGKVYRAVQQMLDRSVAIKLVHPHLLASDAAVARFFAEARAASRMNHPNVVGIFDFGVTPHAEGGELFLVMELLRGPDLATVLADGELLTLPRIADVLSQTLAALGEAHRLGITHRDVKPENIVLEPLRNGREQVKVIDFGIAQVGGGERITTIGQILGTPAYMSPEQIQGGRIGPSADLYAVGVILFELLTGKVPFEHPWPETVLAQHKSAPRPDPRTVAPNREISAALAEVCLRAMDVDPARRYPDAEALAEAITSAATSRPWSNSDASIFATRGGDEVGSEPPPSRAHAPTLDAPSRRSGPSRSPGAGQAPLLGREAELEWARRALADREGAVLVHGRSGTGRTRLLREIATGAVDDGALVLHCPAEPSPRDEVGYGCLRRMLTRLSGKSLTDPALARAAGAPDGGAAEGLLLAFGLGSRPLPPPAARAAAAAALGWAARRAVDRARGAGVVLAVDDVDRIDTPSRWALGDLLAQGGVRGLVVLATSEQPIAEWNLSQARSRPLSGLSPSLAAKLADGESRPELLERGDDIEPLYVELLRRWFPDAGGPRGPASLSELLHARIAALRPSERRTLQAIAVAGSATAESIAALLSRPQDLAAAVPALRRDGLVEVSDGAIRVAHAAFARAVIASAPAGAIAEVCARASKAARAESELFVYYAIRGQPDFDAFLATEQAAQLRADRGDDEGAMALLWQGVCAARSLAAQGEQDVGACAWNIFGRKLASALVAKGRFDEASAVLCEIVEAGACDEAALALVLEQLSGIAQKLGKPNEAKQRRAEALRLAERCGDRRAIERLRSSGPPGREESARSDAPLHSEPVARESGFKSRNGELVDAPPSQRKVR